MNEISQKLKLPEGWKWVRLGEVLQGQNERTGRKELSPVAIGIKGVRERDEIYYKDLAEDYSNNKLFKYGFVAFGLGSDEIAVGVNIYREDHCVSPAYKVFKILNEDILFFHYYMNFIKRLYGNKFLMVSARQGKNVDFKWFIQEHVSLPPLPEQQKIAEILETVDNAREKTDQIIEKYKRIKQGLMQELLTKGIDENGKIRTEKTHHFKASPIGRIPEEWEVKRLGEVTEIYDNKRVPLDSEVRTTMKGEVPYCGATGIIDYINDYIFEGEFVLIAEDGGKFNRFEDTSYIMRGKFWVNNHAHVVKGKNAILNNLFLVYSINFQDIGFYILGSTRDKLNQQVLKSILIPLPPLSEQQRIAAILSQIDEVIEKETQYRDKLKRLKAGLMEDLLTGKVEVNHLIKEEA